MSCITYFNPANHYYNKWTFASKFWIMKILKRKVFFGIKFSFCIPNMLKYVQCTMNMEQRDGYWYQTTPIYILYTPHLERQIVTWEFVGVLFWSQNDIKIIMSWLWTIFQNQIEILGRLVAFWHKKWHELTLYHNDFKFFTYETYIRGCHSNEEWGTLYTRFTCWCHLGQIV